ncbi:MAG: beta-N-acetylglucosaminidase domain-containing protein [Sphingomonadaceae bacterium]|nr:beta-N-acetylglucosaminidase domain-containing protein [Sphingomonadaceae bacterium]
MMPELGIIEGYFGRAWGWTERAAVIDRLAPAGYAFFHYAPKIDGNLRRNWREVHDEADTRNLRAFVEHCARLGVRSGVGLSPYGAHVDFDRETKESLKAKIAWLDMLGIDDLVIMFDDMRGDYADLAERQAEIVSFAIGRSKASRFFMCPSYYSDDPLLDRVFGKRPEGYLNTLGKLLDPAVSVYWTGEEVCSREFSTGHLDHVAQQLGRRPSLWDNYPVNDGPRMSNHLHLRAFTGRPGKIASSLAHHAINPASQPVLGCIPALTLPQSYSKADAYCYASAFMEAATTVCGSDLAAILRADLNLLEDRGLLGIGDEMVRLQRKYADIDHPAAREIVDWLTGGYAITGEMLQTQ